MSSRMPHDIQELLDQIDDPEKMLEFASRWGEYVKKNNEYEQNYQMQFANITEGNLKFKQDKTIPTPAEQLDQFRDLIRDDLNDYLNERQQDKQASAEQDEVTPETPLDQSQELMLTWMKEYKEQQARQVPENPSQEKEDEKTEPSDLKLSFGNEEPSEHGYEPANDNDPTIDELDRY